MTADPARVRALLDEAGISVDGRKAFLGALQAYLTSESPSIDLPLPEPQHQAWIETLRLVSASLKVEFPPPDEPVEEGSPSPEAPATPEQSVSEAVESVHESSEPPPPPPTYRIRMTKAQYLAIKNQAAEQRESRVLDDADAPEADAADAPDAPEPADAPEADAAPADEDNAGGPADEEEEEEEPPAPPPPPPPPPPQSDSSSGFSLSLLDSAALRELDESDGLIVVRKKRR
jgi:hypothetical protein